MKENNSERNEINSSEKKLTNRKFCVKWSEIFVIFSIVLLNYNIIRRSTWNFSTKLTLLSSWTRSRPCPEWSPKIQCQGEFFSHWNAWAINVRKYCFTPHSSIILMTTFAETISNPLFEENYVPTLERKITNVNILIKTEQKLQ